MYNVISDLYNMHRNPVPAYTPFPQREELHGPQARAEAQLWWDQQRVRIADRSRSLSR